MTDSGVFIGDFAPNNQVRADYQQVNYDGRVYRIDAGTGKVTKIESGMKFINGIAFGPDRRLYINDTLTGESTGTTPAAVRSPGPTNCSAT